MLALISLVFASVALSMHDLMKYLGSLYVEQHITRHTDTGLDRGP
jgi:hypothetical protein